MAASGEVNQRLYCCRLQLDYYQQLVAQADLPVSVIYCLAGESSLHHLKALYYAYLKEIAANYNQPQLTPQSAIALTDHIQTAEVEELSSLESTDGSWLSELLQCRQSEAVTRHPGVIMSSVAADTALDVNVLRLTLDELKLLISRQRELTQEW
ncbi:MAG: hypothetical protein ACJA0N_000596 [Pseudohongiellaceae bacterium]|jgi:hypothetical protein